MTIICDICKINVTPIADNEVLEYKIIDLNGKICLCNGCYFALSDFVRSNEFKDVAAKYKKAMEEDLS